MKRRIDVIGVVPSDCCATDRIFSPAQANRRSAPGSSGFIEQASLFRPVDPVREEKERRLMAAADTLNLHYGRGTVRTATAGFTQR